MNVNYFLSFPLEHKNTVIWNTVCTEIKDIKDNLDKKKEETTIINIPKYKKRWDACDIFSSQKNHITTTLNTKYISNAWLKCYEMLNFYLRNNTTCGSPLFENIRHFDNASFPGSFILATHYFSNMIHKKYTWMASSYMHHSESCKKDYNSRYLDDSYGLYKYNPQHYTMSPCNNGDLTNKDVILDIADKLHQKHFLPNIYTSDAGLSYNNYDQEHEQFKTHIGQILCGLLVLSGGGLFVAKQFTFFSKELNDVFFLIRPLFSSLCICKPITSRPANSESYLVGFLVEDFSKMNTYQSIIDKLIEYLDASPEKLKKMATENENILNTVEIMRKLSCQQKSFIDENLQFTHGISHTLNNTKYISSYYEYNPIKAIENDINLPLKMTNRY